jgi:hypothetical protein
MPDIEITEECRALIAAEFPFKETGRRLPSGKWQMPVDAETWKRLQKVRVHGESISDCIIRVIIITLHRRGLLWKSNSSQPKPRAAASIFRLVFFMVRSVYQNGTASALPKPPVQNLGSTSAHLTLSGSPG